MKQCTRVRCFSSIFTKTQSNVGQTVVELRQQLLNVMETSSYLVTTMCKNGARDACLKWISSVIDTNEKRCQQTITHELFYFSTVSVTMESIALRTLLILVFNRLSTILCYRCSRFKLYWIQFKCVLAAVEATRTCEVF